MTRSLFIFLVSLAGAVHADTPLQILDRYQAEVGKVASSQQGRALYHGKFGGKVESCAACHTADPRQAGQHVKTSKAIEPLSPAVSKERFTDPEKVEKWFRRNCNEVLGRTCTAQEKSDFIAYVISQR